MSRRRSKGTTKNFKELLLLKLESFDAASSKAPYLLRNFNIASYIHPNPKPNSSPHRKHPPMSGSLAPQPKLSP
jgi:hypothetical protein